VRPFGVRLTPVVVAFIARVFAGYVDLRIEDRHYSTVVYKVFNVVQ